MPEKVTLYHFPPSYYAQKALFYLLEKGVDFQEEIVNLLKLEQLDEKFLRLNPNGTVPVLVHGEKVIKDSYEIYQYGDDHFSGKPLFPNDHRAEIEKLHKEMEQVDGNLLFYGCLMSDKYSCGMQLPKEMLEHLKSSLKSPDAKKPFEMKYAAAPDDLKPLLQEKGEKMKAFMGKCAKEEELEAMFGTVEKVIQHLEKQLADSKAKLQGAGSNNAITMLILHEPTVADIDLIVLLNRLKVTGLYDKFVSQEKTPNVARFYRQFENRPSFKRVMEALQKGAK